MISNYAGKIQFAFSAKIWRYAGQAAWYFVSLPQDLGREIRENLKSEEEGWGRLKARVKIGQSEWDTSIWYDTKNNTYVLPLKADIRKKEKLEAEQVIETVIWV